MIVYLAHPVRPEAGETLLGNIESAERWLVACHVYLPLWTVIAPWLAEVRAHGVVDVEAEAAQRQSGLERATRIAARCDAVLLAGQRVSDGMRREALACLATGGTVYTVPHDCDFGPARILGRPNCHPRVVEVVPGQVPLLLQ